MKKVIVFILASLCFQTITAVVNRTYSNSEVGIMFFYPSNCKDASSDIGQIPLFKPELTLYTPDEESFMVLMITEAKHMRDKSVWDDSFVNGTKYYATKMWPSGQFSFNKITIDLVSGKRRCLRSTCKFMNNLMGIDLPTHSVLYSFIHNGYLIQFIFNGSFYNTEERYPIYEELVRGLFLAE